MKSFEIADNRPILSVPDPGRIPKEIFQFESLVSPAACTPGVAKPTIAESKVKSPWKPTKLSEELIIEVLTG